MFLLLRHGENVIYSELVNNPFNVRKHAGWAFKQVVNFEAFFSSYVDNISDLTPMSTDHFRAQPMYTPSPDSFDDLQNFEEFAHRSHTRPRIISM